MWQVSAANYRVNFWLSTLGPVNAMNAIANGWHGAPIAAADETKTGGLGEESNKEWRPRTPVPFAQFGQMRPKTPIAALRRLAGYPNPPSPPRLALSVFGRATRLCP